MPADCLAFGSQSSGRQMPAGSLKAEVSTATGGPAQGLVELKKVHFNKFFDKAVKDQGKSKVRIMLQKRGYRKTFNLDVVY